MFKDLNHNLSTFNDRYPVLFELVPPEKGKKEERLIQHSKNLEKLLNETEVDALNIPEIQNESKKGKKGKRRSPYKERVEPRRYARALSDKFDTDFVINRVFVKHSPERQEKWMIETYQEYDIDKVIIVGGESSKIKYEGPSVSAGNKLTKRYLNRGELKYNEGEVAPTNFTVGNICIPTRRRNDFDEPERMYHKLRSGADFFTTQIITEPESSISLLKDFSELLMEEEADPPLIFWSFTPISSQKDVDFLRWLGVHIPENTENLILSRSNPADASADIMQSVWEKIIDFNQQLPVPIPMGINISVMGLRNFDNGIRLARELNMVGVPE